MGSRAPRYATPTELSNPKVNGISPRKGRVGERRAEPTLDFADWLIGEASKTSNPSSKGK